MSRLSYNTRQKESILEYLRANAGKHIKVCDIYNELRLQGCNIGASTIYRYLDRLTAENKIKKYLLDGNAAACYQYGDENDDEDSTEYHLRCSKCGGLFHFQSEEISSWSKAINRNGLRVDLKSTVFAGECDACNNK